MNNLIIFAVGFASVSAFVYSIPLGLFVFGVGLMLIGLLFDFERL
jgi:hypothetical protein